MGLVNRAKFQVPFEGIAMMPEDAGLKEFGLRACSVMLKRPLIRHDTLVGVWGSGFKGLREGRQIWEIRVSRLQAWTLRGIRIRELGGSKVRTYQTRIRVLRASEAEDL